MPRRLEMQGRRVWWPLRLKVNEVLCKVLCYHLTCLIQEQETLGIAPVFWKNELEEAEGRSDVLLVRTGMTRATWTAEPLLTPSIVTTAVSDPALTGLIVSPAWPERGVRPPGVRCVGSR